MVFAPFWDGEGWDAKSPYQDATALHFSPNSQRLLVAHREGQVCIWETNFGYKEPQDTTTQWEATTLLAGEQVLGLTFRPESVVSSPTEGTRLLFHRALGSVNNEAVSHFEIVYGHLEAGGLRLTPIDEVDISKVREGVGLVTRSLGLWATTQGDWFGYRKPTESYGGEYHLFRKVGDSVQRREKGQAGNCWFEPFLRLQNERPEILHFSHGNDCPLLATLVTSEEQELLGFHRDGFRMSGAVDSEGRIHTAFYHSHRSEARPLAYLQVAADQQNTVKREEIDTHHICVRPRLALDSQQRPHVFYVRSTADGRYQIVHAQRAAEHWTTQVIREGLTSVHLFDTRFDPKGVPWLLYHESVSDLCLAHPEAGQWLHERIRQTNTSTLKGWLGAEVYSTALIWDRQGRLQVLLGLHTQYEQWLKILQRKSP